MKSYTKIPNSIFETSQLSTQSRFLYCALLKYCGKDEACFPSQETLAKNLHFSSRHIRKLLEELIKAGLVSKIRKGFNRSNTYIVSKDLTINRKPVPAQPTINNKLNGHISSSHSGTPLPLHGRINVPTKSTYTKGKDKTSLTGIEWLRKDLEKKGIIPKTKPILSTSSIA